MILCEAIEYDQFRRFRHKIDQVQTSDLHFCLVNQHFPRIVSMWHMLKGETYRNPSPTEKKTQFHPALCFASKITQLPPACLRSTSGDSSEPRRSAGKFCSTFRPAEARIIFAIAPIQLFQLQVISGRASTDFTLRRSACSPPSSSIT